MSGSLQVQRENTQLKKIAWSVGSKETSTTHKKESWNGIKFYHEKKKLEASGGNETTKDGVVHSIGYVAVVDAKDWPSVID